MAKDAPDEKSLKNVFVISPIAKVDDDGFDFTKLFLEEIVKPAVAEVPGFGTPVRADDVRAPGSITSKVVSDIVAADVCIADLTGRNPNVMYEVAIAHAADKPVILLQQESGGPPFDFTDERVIQYSTRADRANSAKRKLAEYLRNAHHEDGDEHLQRTMHPVRTIFRQLQARENASDPQQAILDRIELIAKDIQDFKYVPDIEPPPLRPEQKSSPSGPIRPSVRANYIKSRNAGEALRPGNAKPADLTEIYYAKIQGMIDKYLGSDLSRNFADHTNADSPYVEQIDSIHSLLTEVEDNSKLTQSQRKAILNETSDLIRALPPF